MLGDLVAKQGRRRLREIDVDPAAGANGRPREQCGRNRLEAVDAGDNVGDGGADPCGVLSLPTLIDTRPEKACATESEPGRFE